MVEIYVVQTVRVFPFVPFRPFLDITYGPDRLQVHARNDIGRALLLNQIRKRQISRVQIVDMTSHYKGKSADLGRPQYI